MVQHKERWSVYLAKTINKINNCDECEECQYIGDGDFVCMKNEDPVIVKSRWLPTEHYNNCIRQNKKI